MPGRLVRFLLIVHLLVTGAFAQEAPPAADVAKARELVAAAQAQLAEAAALLESPPVVPEPPETPEEPPEFPEIPELPADPLLIRVAPGTAPLAGKTVDALQAAIEQAPAGATVLVAPGTYREVTLRDAQDVTIRAEQPGTVFLDSLEWDALALVGPNVDRLTFDGLTFTGGRAGVMTFGGSTIGDDSYADVTFVRCTFDGQFDHVTGTGRHTKWGAMLHKVERMAFVDCRFMRVKLEHGIYAHQVIDGLLVLRCWFSRLGRCAVQEANRPSENGGAPGSGLVLIQDSYAEDCGLGDYFGGGSAFTFSAHKGPIVLRDTKYRAGFADDVKAAALAAVGRYGTGALVVWAEQSSVVSGPVVLDGFDAEFAPGCGFRPVAQVSDTEALYLVGDSRFVAGGAGSLNVAFSLSPPGTASGGVKQPVGFVHAEPGIQYVGKTLLNGVEVGKAPVGPKK